VIACYNEEPIFRESIDKLFDVMSATCWNYEIIFVDDHSRDATPTLIDEVIQNHPRVNLKKIFHAQNIGRGRAVADGIRASRGTYVGYLDIDLEVGAHYIPLMINALKNGADVATAFRVYKATLHLFNRVVLSIGYRILLHLFLKLPVKDTETGFKFFNRAKVMTILDQADDPGWFWDTQIMAYAYHAGMKIVELPCLFIRRYDKKSSVKVFRDSAQYFANLLRFSKRISALTKQAD
jgi:glycosyltransferase involved in cell wall biosynthesis